MNVIKKPVVTEKTLGLYKDDKKATFVVALDATKSTVKAAIKATFGVTPLKVTIMNRLGKKRENRLNKKIEQKKPNLKLAIIKLNKEDKIQIFEPEKK